jgi:hypothetical protein
MGPWHTAPRRLDHGKRRTVSDQQSAVVTAAVKSTMEPAVEVSSAMGVEPVEIREGIEAMEARELFAAKERLGATTVAEAPAIRRIRTRRKQRQQHD